MSPDETAELKGLARELTEWAAPRALELTTDKALGVVLLAQRALDAAERCARLEALLRECAADRMYSEELGDRIAKELGSGKVEP